MKQELHDKGGGGIGGGLATEDWEHFFEFSGTGLGAFPLVSYSAVEIVGDLDRLARELAVHSPSNVVANAVGSALAQALKLAREKAASIRRRMIALQEELDWHCYKFYGLLDEALEFPAPPEIELGQRAFEVVMARRVEEGELETTWFERHRSTPVTELIAPWPDDYLKVVEKRIALIDSDKFIGLIERPEYKRRWNNEPSEEQEQRALRLWLLDWLEATRHWFGDPQLKSVSRLADAARADGHFMEVAESYFGRADFEVLALLGELVASESVPFLPVLRYTDSGLRKRSEWEVCWNMQRREDAIDAQVAATLKQRDDESADAYAIRLATDQKKLKAKDVGDFPVPPKYKSTDFRNTTFWRLRGGLDVPKERFISYPHCSRDADGSLVIAWAGWDHLQQATGLAAYYLKMKESEGWLPERLKPLLAGIQELVPWLKQWHNDYNAEHATRMGDYFESFVVDEARALGFTLADLSAWTPPAKQTAGRGRKKKEAVS
jgi:hypothetical protein